MQAKLLVVGGGQCEQEEFLLSLPTTIGRGRENQITLPHQLVSRKHCEIYEGDDGLVVRDLNSLNGTYVGNLPIHGEHPLRPGDLLTIGIVTFRMVLLQPDGSEAGLRLESVLDEDLADANDETRLGSGHWSAELSNDESSLDNTPGDNHQDATIRRAKAK